MGGENQRKHNEEKILLVVHNNYEFSLKVPLRGCCNHFFAMESRLLELRVFSGNKNSESALAKN